MDANSDSTNLDLLRSMAVVLVVCFHLLFLLERSHGLVEQQLGGIYSIGNWGVLIFFVHTSLVLMFSLERQHNRFPDEPAWLPFLTRRVFRIYPLSMFVVLVVALFRIPLGDIIGGHFVAAPLHWTGVVANLLLVQNLTHAPSSLVPLWSLPYEMQMYLFLPVLFLLVRNARSVIPIGLLWIVASIAAIPAERLDQMGMPNLPEFAPFFLSGIVAYVLTRIPRRQLPAWIWPFAIAAITALYLYHPNAHRGWVCALLLAVALPHFREISWPAAKKASHIVARYSYGIYLTHFLCMWLAFQACAHLPVWLRVVVFLITIPSIPVVLYHIIESPMIRLGATLASAMQSAMIPAVGSEAC